MGTLWIRKKRKWKWNIFFSQSDAFCWSCDVRKEYFFGISSKFCNKEWDCRGCQEETVILSYVLHICAKHLLPKDFILQIHPKGKYHCWRSSRSCKCSQYVKQGTRYLSYSGCLQNCFFFSASNRTRLLWIINFCHLDMCLFQFSEITIIVIFMAVFSIAQLLWECWFRGNVFFARNGEVGHLVLPGLLSAENAALEKYEPLCLCQLSGNTTNFLKKYFCTPPEIHLISYFVKQNQAAFSFSPVFWPLFQNPNTELK